MKTILFMVIVCCAFFAKAQQTTVRFNQLDSLQQVQPKKVFVFIHTKWCSYCQAMDEVVFKDKTITKLLQEEYYFVHLDAEEKSVISYANHKFAYNATKGIHDLAIAFADKNGKVVFPTICILSPKHEILYQQEGLIKTAALTTVLNYFKAKN